MINGTWAGPQRGLATGKGGRDLAWLTMAGVLKAHSSMRMNLDVPRRTPVSCPGPASRRLHTPMEEP